MNPVYVKILEEEGDDGTSCLLCLEKGHKSTLQNIGAALDRRT